MIIGINITIQREVCKLIRWLHHIANGGLRNIAVASKLKLEGVES